jgi:hypothetical protein
MTEDMEKELIALLSGSIIEREDDTPSRLSTQEDALKDSKCIEPRLGRWIDSCDFPFLIETLALDDTVFSQEFPNVKLEAAERKRFANDLEAHCEVCTHCHLKRAYDLEWQSRVKRAFADNKQAAGEIITRAIGKR